ncbi:GNAT family N-acetyltransferase [Nocardia tengchongensis]|uniref:GNAT family N-acetyltransferase n=1 Tax=Nocardia tengchongensis TaxID=2055889 RepID=A0ABX8CJB9_9NOCA|nr:GNAT family N-acetyltransferase [Nocardia tengchongensis]QVI18953.1 GNAT family N-acetyltransferase [Nocardia tengchongensis]
MNTNSVDISRVESTRWEAVENDLVVGHGEVSQRPDGRLFVSIDAWHDQVFDQIAAAMLATLRRPLHTVVDEADGGLLSCWGRAGFVTRRRESEYLVSTDPGATGLGAVTPPPDITVVPAGSAEEGPLRLVDRVIRDEVESTIGWQEMPAEILRGPGGDTVMNPSLYVAAAQADRYVGLLRVAQVTRLPRLGLIAVRADQRRRGIGRAMLAQSLGALHGRGIPTATAEVNESNAAAMALFESIGARRVAGNLELVLR